MAFDWYADYFIENKLGRAISQAEALAIQDRCEEAGLVSQGSNLDPCVVLCHCCQCCCLPLRANRKYGHGADTIVSSFYAAVQKESCTGCELCMQACQTGAISMADAVAEINREHCIGCGLCVAACPTNAMELAQKPEVKPPLTRWRR